MLRDLARLAVYAVMMCVSVIKHQAARPTGTKAADHKAEKSDTSAN